MAVEIARSLEEIDNKVKGLNKSLRESSAETKELDKALKLDSKSTETVEKKMTSLQTAVGTAAQKVALLRQKQDEANKAFAKGDISASEYKKIELSVLKAENELKTLNNEIGKTQKMRVDQTAASFDSLTAKLGKVQNAAQKVAKVATAILASLTAAATAFVIIGDELDDTGKKFHISAEELQKQRNLYSKITDDAKNYDSALSSLNSVMTSIAKGKGTAYLTTLEKLGVSTTDASGKTKSAAEVYGEVMVALGAVADETERASLASILFGENGLNVANVAALSREEITAYTEELANHGIVSSEAAAQAGAIADKIDDCKQQISAASGELMVALLPVILELIGIAQTTIIPIITTIADWFADMSPAQQKLVFFLLMLIIIVPKVVSVITAIIAVVKAITIASYGAAGGVGAVSAASIPLQPILIAVAAAILVVVILFAMLAGKSKDVTKELNNQKKAFSDMESEYSGMAADMGVTTDIVSNNSTRTTSTVDYNVNITAEGDTPISQENADMVADNLADRINASLGGKI
jgi:phage-related minor tail protein